MDLIQSNQTAESLAWMTGVWTCQIWGGTFEEIWSSPLGGMLVGAGKHVVNGELKFLEFLTIESVRHGFAMKIRPVSSGEELIFPLTSLTDSEAIFENTQYEFPRTITYRRIGDALLANVEGVQRGEQVSYQFDYRNRL